MSSADGFCAPADAESTDGCSGRPLERAPAAGTVCGRRRWRGCLLISAELDAGAGRLLVPRLHADLAGDLAVAELENSGAQHVGAVGVTACFGEGCAALSHDLHIDAVGHVAFADVFDPGTDFVASAEDAWRGGGVDPVDECDLGIWCVVRELAGAVALLDRALELAEIECWVVVVDMGGSVVVLAQRALGSAMAGESLAGICR